MVRLALTRICTVDRMALTWNLSFGQVRIDLELMLRTGWYSLGICLVDNMTLTWS